MSINKINTVEPKQCRAARGLLDWSQEDLAKKINGSKKTITDFEKGNRIPQKRTVEDIRAAFEKVGIEFENDERACGVRLVK